MGAKAIVKEFAGRSKVDIDWMLFICIFGKNQFAENMKFSGCLFAFFQLFALAGNTQELLEISHACAYDGKENSNNYHCFDASKEADTIVQEICSAVSLEKNFVVRASNVTNALAAQIDGKRVILYSTIFLEKFKADSRTRWAAYSVLAHEIGHHLNGHYFDESDPQKRKTMELEADRFSGGTLRLLGASLDEAKAGLETMGGTLESQTHPPASARREAVASGWKKQDEHLKTLGLTVPEMPGLPVDTDGDGLSDAEDKCPENQGLASNQGCPELPDNMVRLPGGTFEMGDIYADGQEQEKPSHFVDVSAFYISKTEITFDEYDSYALATGAEIPWDEGWGHGKNPVINITWIDALRYCNWLSSQYGLSPIYEIKDNQVKADWNANGFRLPTEAEWEYAARGAVNAFVFCQGGFNVRFGNGSKNADPDAINFNAAKELKLSYSTVGINRKKIIPVGNFSPSCFELYDMSGNVSEWVWDFFGPYSYSAETEKNPHGPVSGFYHVHRGGSWSNGPSEIRTTARDWKGPMFKGNNLGFRLARNAD